MRTIAHLREFDLNLLVLFDALMGTGQLTAAARHLGMTQSAASQALGRLREALDDPLFIRVRGGMQPTPAARLLAPEVKRALRTLRDAFGASRAFDPGNAEREFRIAFGDVGELSLLPRIATVLAGAGKGLRASSLPGGAADARALVRQGEADLCLDYRSPREVDLRHAPLGSDPLVVIARRDHPRVRRRLSLKRFMAERHVLVHVDAGRRARVQARLPLEARGRNVLAAVAHYASVPALVLASDALAIVPRSLSQAPPHGPLLTSLPVPFALDPLSLFAIWHAALDADPGHRWFRDTLSRLRKDG